MSKTQRVGILVAVGIGLLTACGGGSGGGSLGGSKVPPPPSSIYIPPVSAAVGTSPDGHPLSRVLLSPKAQEVRLLELINEVRTKGTVNGQSAGLLGTCVYPNGTFTPRQALTYNGVLAHSAQQHARYMGEVGYLAHDEVNKVGGVTSENPANPLFFWGEGRAKRIERSLRENNFGTQYDFLIQSSGENVGAGTPSRLNEGYSSPESMITAWANSAGHCANLMNPEWDYMGTGYFYNPTPVDLDPATGLRRHTHSWVQLFAKGTPPEPTIVFK